MTKSVKTLAFRFFWRSMHWGSSFSVWKFLDHWASKTKAKSHCWHTNCRIRFVINYLAIHYTNIKKIGKYSQVKTKFASSFNLITNFHLIMQIDSSHILVILTDNSWAWSLRFVFRSLYSSFNLLSQLLDHSSWIVRWWICCPSILWQTVWHVCQSCSPCFICLSCFKDGICLEFAVTVTIL